MKAHTTHHAAVRQSRAPGQWREVARQWNEFGPPLRPAEEDIALFTDALSLWKGTKIRPRALILGVTPELYRLPWREHTEVIAVDCTPAMIDALWPGPRGSAICGEWSCLPLKNGSFDIVLCDGGLNLLAYPDGHLNLAQSLNRIIAPGGLCLLRLFVPPKRRETVSDVMGDLLAGQISDVNMLKLRLWMALHQNPAQGILLNQVWDIIHATAPDSEDLAKRIGWSMEHFSVIHAYKDNLARYHFISTDRVIHLFCNSPGGFIPETTHVPTYERGDCCPIVVLKKV